MKVISTGSEYRLYNDHLKVHDKLPAGSYIVQFSSLQGFYLEEYSEIEIREDKIYGIHLKKVEKCLKAFDISNRSLGVILSGSKGIGKSLFAKLLGKAAIEKGFALIVVNKYISGIGEFIESIEQEVVVLFDEFDKTFAGKGSLDDGVSPQNSLLSLFDGVADGKKLYIVTCNDLYKLSDFLVNRPGRFHYHFRFEYPDSAEIKEYLQDKLKEKYWGEIQKVIIFSRKVDLNYDCLRAIAFEIQNGDSFEDAIKDLNIVNVDCLDYKLVLRFTNGAVMTCSRYEMDMFDSSMESECCRVWDREERNSASIYFHTEDSEYNTTLGCPIIAGEKIRVVYDDDSEAFEELKKLVPKYLEIHKVVTKSIKYVV